MGRVIRFRRRRFKPPALPGWLSKPRPRSSSFARSPWQTLAVLVVLSGLLWLATEWMADDDARFRLCVRGSQQDCVVDGDTFRYRGETIRVSDIDAPEVRDYQCASEAALGHRATERLLSLLNAGAFRLEAPGRDRDRYGRLLRVVIRDGRSLGDVLIDEGLARRWHGARRSWC